MLNSFNFNNFLFLGNQRENRKGVVNYRECGNLYPKLWSRTRSSIPLARLMLMDTRKILRKDLIFFFKKKKTNKKY